jgi:hypothetical protein
MSGIKKFWKRITKDPSETESPPEWLESIWWFINNVPVQNKTLDDMFEEARRRREVRELLTPEQYVKWHVTVSEGIERRSSGKPPLGAEELFKIAKEKRLRPGAQILYLAKKKVMDGEAKRVAEAEATRLALQDRPRLDAEIEEWVASIDREQLKQWVNEELKTEARVSNLTHHESQVIIESQFDYLIKLYDPMRVLYWTVGGIDAPYHISAVDTRGARLAVKSKFNAPYCARAFEEDVDLFSVDFRREIHNDEYVVKGRLRKMKELYMEVFIEMRARGEFDKLLCLVIYDKTGKEIIDNFFIREDIWQEFSGYTSLDTFVELQALDLWDIPEPDLKEYTRYKDATSKPSVSCPNCGEEKHPDDALIVEADECYHVREELWKKFKGRHGEIGEIIRGALDAFIGWDEYGAEYMLP